MNDRIAQLEEQLRIAKLERRIANQKPRDEPGGLLYWTIGAAIRRARDAAGMTQEDVARLVDFKRTSLANIEAGRQRLPIATLYDIADALGVQATSLLPRNEDV